MIKIKLKKHTYKKFYKVSRLRTFKPAVLTVDSDGTVAAMDPNIDENQSWTLVKINEE